MSVDTLITNLIDQLSREGQLPPYLYLANQRHFDPDRDWVYYGGPTWDEAELTAALTTFLTGKWLVSGEAVARFEQAFARRCGQAAAVMVNSGSSANLVMLAALKTRHGWCEGDEIIVSPVGFPTTIAPIIQNGLRPVFTDIDFQDLNFSLDQVERAIGAKTRAILISPVLGNPPDMDRLQEIAARHGVMLVLDGCDSLGSRWRGHDLAHYAAATSCSFYPAHHICTGEGGMVSANDRELVKLARSFAWWGRDCFCVGTANLSAKGACGRRFECRLEGRQTPIDHKYYFTHQGYNLKPLDLQGAIGLAQLEKLEHIHTARRRNKQRIAAIFAKHLQNAIAVPDERPQAETSWFGVPLVCRDQSLKQRLVAHLEQNRIQTRNYFAGNILLHPGYSDLGDATLFPAANQVLDRVFFVGCHPAYQEETLAYIDRVMGDFAAGILVNPENK